MRRKTDDEAPPPRDWLRVRDGMGSRKAKRPEREPPETTRIRPDRKNRKKERAR